MKISKNILPCPTEPIPVGSKTDPTMAKDASDHSRASGITYLRNGKNPSSTAGTAREKSENMQEKQICSHQASEEGELQAWDQKSTCSLWRRPPQQQVEAQIGSVNLWEFHTGAVS